MPRSKFTFNTSNTYCTADGKDGLRYECDVFKIPQIGCLEKVHITDAIQCACPLESVRNKKKKIKNK